MRAVFNEQNQLQGIYEASLSRHTCLVIVTGFSHRKKRIWVLDSLEQNHDHQKKGFFDEIKRPRVLFELALFFLCQAGQAIAARATSFLRTVWYRMKKDFLRLQGQ